jgi:Fic family protein
VFKPKYIITNSILNKLTEVTIARELIQKARLIPKWEVSLRRDALINSVHASTHIEGNILSLEEVSRLALGREVSSIRKDKQEVINYLNVLSNLENYIPKDKFTIEWLLDIHKRLVQKTLNNPEYEGKFRTKQVIIGRKDVDGRTLVTFVPPKTKDVPKLVQNFFDWLNGSEKENINKVILAGITHYELVRIHPFMDGNGRTARIMATLMFLMKGFDTKRFFALDDYYDSDRVAYYDALKTVDPKDGDLTKWLEYFCEGVLFSVNRVKKKVLELSGEKKLTGSMEQVALTDRQMHIVEMISKEGRLTSRQMQESFKISPQAVHKEIKKLIKMRVVKLVGSGRGAYYELL